MMSIALIALSFRFMGSSGSGGYRNLSLLLLAAANTGYLIIASLLQMFRGLFYSPYDEDEEEDELEEISVGQ